MPNDVRDLPASNDGLYRFLGGSPLAVAFRLILLSILVGVVLAAIGFDPWNILNSIRLLFQRLWDLGFDADQLAVALLPARRRDRDPDLAAVAAVRRPARPIAFPKRRQPMQLQFVGCGDALGSGGRVNTCFHVTGAHGQFPDRLRRLVAAGAEAARHRARDYRPDPDHAFPRRPFWRPAVPAARRAVHAGAAGRWSSRARKASRRS